MSFTAESQVKLRIVGSHGQFDDIEERLGVNNVNSLIWSQVMNSIGLEAGEFEYIEYPLYSEALRLYGMRYTPGTIMGLQTLLFSILKALLCSTLMQSLASSLKGHGTW